MLRKVFLGHDSAFVVRATRTRSAARRAVDEVSGERFSDDAPRPVLPMGSLPY